MSSAPAFVRRLLLGTMLLALAPLARAVPIGPQEPLVAFRTYTLGGDFVAAGVGLRNRGAGTIPLDLPDGAAVIEAFLYWTIIAPEEPPATATLNDAAITGTVVAEVGSPCWPTQNDALADPPSVLTWVYRADVTDLVIDGDNVVAGLPSGLTGGQDAVTPAANRSAFPLLDGASLVVVWTRPGERIRTITLADGGQTFFAGIAGATLGLATPAGPSPVARTGFVVADGQAGFAGDRASVQSVVVAGPGGAIRSADAFDGSDGGGLHGLWDTLVVDATGLVAPGATSVGMSVESGAQFDCLTWVAQALSVTTGTTTTTTTAPPTSSTLATTTSTSTSSTSTTSSTTSSSTTSTTTTTSSTSSSTTTTTSTTSPSTTTSTSSTTTTSTTTTSTTLPGCDRAATYASLLCRIDALIEGVQRAELNPPTRRSLLNALTKARVQVAEAQGEGGRRAAARLRKAARRMTSFGYRVRSLVGVRAIDPAVQAGFQRDGESIRVDLLALRGGAA